MSSQRLIRCDPVKSLDIWPSPQRWLQLKCQHQKTSIPLQDQEQTRSCLRWFRVQPASCTPAPAARQLCLTVLVLASIPMLVLVLVLVFVLHLVLVLEPALVLALVLGLIQEFVLGLVLVLQAQGHTV